tara:strand:- start:2244 stop:2417 length:174 start_codon:yes stop_codon:yes gene_type:complete
MDLQLPKWMAKELYKDTDRSLQYYIKHVIKEYLNDPEWREKVIEKERGKEGGRVLNT